MVRILVPPMPGNRQSTDAIQERRQQGTRRRVGMTILMFFAGVAGQRVDLATRWSVASIPQQATSR